MSAIITVKNIRKVYRVGNEKVVALDDINIEIEKGEICCILGTSGSGKSTLLNQLAGLEKPTSGYVMIGNSNISTMSENQLAGFRQRNIGFIFQSYNLLGSLTASENVSMPLLFRGVDKNVRNKAAAEMLRKVGLGDRARHKPTEMSGGQQQRVGIARAFVAKPKIVFADEPTGNLDTKTTIEVMDMLVNMAHDNDITFILVTHNNELARCADRIITLRDGRVISDVRNDSKANCMRREQTHCQESEVKEPKAQSEEFKVKQIEAQSEELEVKQIEAQSDELNKKELAEQIANNIATTSLPQAEQQNIKGEQYV